MIKAAQLDVTNKILQPRSVLCCKYSTNGELIFSGGMDGVVRGYKTGTQELVHKFVDLDLETEPNPVTAVKMSPKHPDLIVATYAKGLVKVWSMKRSECLKTVAEGRQCLGLSVSPKMNKLLTMGDDAQLWLYDLETMKLERRFYNSYAPNKMEGHTSRVFAAKFHPTNSFEFISGGWDDTIQFWDLRKSTSIRYLTGPHICGEGLDFDPEGENILTCAYQQHKSLQLWHYRTGKLLVHIDTETAKLYCGKYIAPRFVATGGSDPCTVRIINMFSYGTVNLFKLPHVGVYSLDSWSKSEVKDINELNETVLACTNESLVELRTQYTFT